MTAYYNENDPRMAAVLRELIAAGHIAHGIVDERSISDVKPGDLSEFVQCHFFAGIGVWSHALRLASWPDTRPVWTASCPCQPFSGAGKGLGFADKRHLWPDLHWLISQCRPDTLYGEQVSDKGGPAWIDLVCTDMEGSGYAIGALVAPAACVGAPHMRHRTYFMAYNDRDRRAAASLDRVHHQEPHPEPRGVSDGMGDPFIARLEGLSGNGDCGRQSRRFDPFKAGPIATASLAGRLADTHGAKPQQSAGQGSGSDQAASGWSSGELDGCGELSAGLSATGPTNGFWRSADWLHGRDGKWRCAESRTQSVVDGFAARMGCVLPGHVQDIELDIAEWTIRHQADPGKALSDLWMSLSARNPSGRLEDLGLFTRRQFCSLSCANSRDKGGLSRKAFHARARKQRKPACESCGSKNRLHVHHINEDWTNNQPENLQTLCIYCHQFWHAMHRRLGVRPSKPMPPLVFLSPMVPGTGSPDFTDTVMPSSRNPLTLHRGIANEIP
jgi:DNA (cytosine-5)-methyltransferase 1